MTAAYSHDDLDPVRVSRPRQQPLADREDIRPRSEESDNRELHDQ